MPLYIPEPRASGTTATTPVPLYWARYGPDPLDPPHRPTLICLHGGPGADHRYLLPQMLHLAERYDLLFYDQRGGGKSRMEDNSPVSWRDHVADLALVCKEFGIVNPSIVGYSWGAMLSLLYTNESLADPELPAPERLILISPGPANMVYRGEFDNNMRRRGSTDELNAERETLASSGLRESDPDAYRQRLFELGVAAYFADTKNATNLTPFRVVGRVQQSVWESLGNYDIPALVRGIDVPAVMVHGEKDPIPFQSSQELAKSLGIELTIIENCGHVPYVEKPEELWAVIDPFLEQTDPQ